VSSSKQQQQKLATVSNDLRSGDEKKISTSLKSLHVHGDASIIPVLLEIWEKGLSLQNESDMKELLVGLKDTSTITPLIEGFRTTDNREFQRKLLNIFWNSKLDFSPFLSDFIVFAIEGDFMDCLESLTVIEQFESTVPESAILESQLLLKEYFSKEEKLEEKKYQLLQEIMILLKDFDADGELDEFYYEEED
jgi:hypothetical protein